MPLYLLCTNNKKKNRFRFFETVFYALEVTEILPLSSDLLPLTKESGVKDKGQRGV